MHFATWHMLVKHFFHPVLHTLVSEEREMGTITIAVRNCVHESCRTTDNDVVEIGERAEKHRLTWQCLLYPQRPALVDPLVYPQVFRTPAIYVVS